jgi:hypothetical protein
MALYVFMHFGRDGSGLKWSWVNGLQKWPEGFIYGHSPFTRQRDYDM